FDVGIIDDADADDVADRGQLGRGRRRLGRRVGERLQSGRTPGPQRRGVPGLDDPPRHRRALAAQSDEPDPHHATFSASVAQDAAETARAGGRQTAASSPPVATTATPSAMPPPAQLVTEMPSRRSSENRPGPSAPSATETTASTRTYS